MTDEKKPDKTEETMAMMKEIETRFENLERGYELVFKQAEANRLRLDRLQDMVQDLIDVMKKFAYK